MYTSGVLQQTESKMDLPYCFVERSEKKRKRGNRGLDGVHHT